MLTDTFPSLVIAGTALLGANCAKIAIPPVAVRLSDKRAARALLVLWLIPMAACCAASAWFARSFAAVDGVNVALSEGGERWGQHAALDIAAGSWLSLPVAVAVVAELLSAASLLLMRAASSSPAPEEPRSAPSPSPQPYAAGFAAAVSIARPPAPAPVLLAAPPSTPVVRASATPSDQARKLERALADHGVRGRVTGVTGDGPVVIRYAFRPAPGVKLGKIEKLAGELAMELNVTAVSVTPAPEDGVICFDLPKAKRRTVELEEVYASAEYQDRSVALPLALGVDIAGRPVVADLADMPHLLIAGATGSGKSVGLNAMVLGLLNRLTPAECRFIMIDPKMLELSVYDGVPHLLTPVVVDPGEAVNALNWAAQEMAARYERMSGVARGLAEYNAKMLEPDRLPRIVIVIDEFADLMLSAGKGLPNAVQRLGQKARAAGIHLIMATQRPDAKTVTGVIKANFPGRLSYAVASRIDAVVIGLPGAENLLGRGDLLFRVGGGPVTRVHGPFVSSAYVEAMK